MLKKRIKALKGKKIAIVAMGNSQLDYHMAITHSQEFDEVWVCLLYTSPSQRDRTRSRMPSSA